MFTLNSNPMIINSNQISIIYGTDGITPYNITLSNVGTIEKIDDLSAKFTPDNTIGNYIAVFWAKDIKGGLARTFVKVQN